MIFNDMPDDRDDGLDTVWTIIDWINSDEVNADPDVAEDADDDEAIEWDEMSDYDLDGEEGEEDDGEFDEC